MATGTYRISERKCATCNWWCGTRKVELSGGKPYYVKAEAAPAGCSVRSSENRTPGSTCSNWRCWTVLSNAQAWNVVKGLAKWLIG